MTQSLSYLNHQIHCSIAGEGEVLVFLHGWPTNARLWASQVAALKAHFKIITFDWLGFGQSDKPKEDAYSFRNMKDILDTVLTNLLRKDEKVNIIAHDIGGPPAILWASENQDRIKRLVLLNTVIYPFSTPLDKVSHFFFAVPLIKDIIMSRFGLSLLMNILAKSGDRAIRSRVKNVLDAHHELDNEVKLKSILDPLKVAKKKEFLHLANTYQALDVEKHLIIAKGDPLCYQHIKKLSEDNPEVPTYVIDKCGHYIPMDQPRALNDILSSILIERKLKI